ncbi:hypothetical protein KDL01_14170 [Actinospica durhamensis]|uniref:Uncharacterized protein n=1 Tax=Actinospica durhamensis TaxID=1508375 RepID=A0A941IQN4_9ACTN|nr:hypothetical protein [Actinospica durhamensis]MBR7834417.1 hypothetical protein [Actinospica durhamensis]
MDAKWSQHAYPEEPQDARPVIEDARPVIEDARPALENRNANTLESERPAAPARPRVRRNLAFAGFVGAVALIVGAVAIFNAGHQVRVGGIGPPQPQAAQMGRIPSNLLLVGDTPAGYRPVAGSVSEEGATSPFIATYTCVSHCPADSAPGQAPSIMFSAAQSGPGYFSDYKALCGPNPAQSYVCGKLAPDMWRATAPSSPRVYQIVIYEHGDVEFILQAPPTMDPQLLRAYMLSIHRASDAELVSLLKGYPNYS